MCYNCGCHIPQDDMGHPDNITEKILQEQAKKLNLPEEGLKENLFQYLSQNKNDSADFETMFGKAAKAWGQSVDEAKKNAMSMLKEELKH